MVRCADCSTPHHAACFVEHGRCTIFACNGTKSLEGIGAEIQPGSLSPFLPVWEQPSSRRPVFLKIRRQVDAVAERRKILLRLSAPQRARCGQRLEGTVEAYVPRILHGHGLRLIAETEVRRGKKNERLYREEAVLAGGPRRSWLERLKIWRDLKPPVLLQGGLTTFHYSFDPKLHWSWELPVDVNLGHWHTLKLKAVVDSPYLTKETREQRVLVAHAHRRCGIEVSGQER